jgi:hypothetical protein
MAKNSTKADKKLEQQMTDLRLSIPTSAGGLPIRITSPSPLPTPAEALPWIRSAMSYPYPTLTFSTTLLNFRSIILSAQSTDQLLQSLFTQYLPAAATAMDNFRFIIKEQRTAHGFSYAAEVELLERTYKLYEEWTKGVGARGMRRRGAVEVLAMSLVRWEDALGSEFPDSGGV